MHADADLQCRIAETRAGVMLEKYGAPTSMQSPELKKKIQSTMIDRYGSISPMGDAGVQGRQQASLFARYGVTIPAKNADIAKKSGVAKKKSTWDARVLSLADSFKYIDEQPFDNKADRLWQCLSCSSTFTHNWDATQRNPVCRSCQPMTRGTSIFEQEIYDFLSSNCNLTIERNRRFYYGRQYYELDIFIPELNFGIEFNGLYWHSELAGKDKNYHKTKKEFFDASKIRVLFIFEHEWVKNSSICKSMILHKLGLSLSRIGARDCTVIPLDKNVAADFVKSNHIAGYASHSIAYGLEYNNKLVAVATFKVDRFGKDKSVYELIRFCTAAGYSISGALSRLISRFQADYKKPVKTFCDLRWGDGQSYIKSGFKCVKITLPCCWYFDKYDVVYHRSVFQKKKLLSILDMTDSTYTEWQLAQKLNLNRFWDCGNMVLYKEV